MFKRANSAESSTGSPSKSPKSPPLSVTSHANNNLSTHICPLCSRVFSSIQALGGHQNAHRKERFEEKAQYIRQRLENHKNIISANNHLVSSPPESHYYSYFDTRSNDFEVGHSHKKTKIMINDDYDNNNNYTRQDEEEGEGETVSLELTLAIGGRVRAKGGSGFMAYNYPDVLFPASEFKETKVDLNLKL